MKNKISINNSQLSYKCVDTNNNRNNIKCTFDSPIYTSSLAGNIIVYMPSRGRNKEKNFILNN